MTEAKVKELTALAPLAGRLTPPSDPTSGGGSRVGTIQYVYRSVSIPYSTPVSCMVSPSPNMKTQ